MIVAAFFRIDYPQWSFVEDQSRELLSENEPLGLFFGPADSGLSGLRVLIANDAEQIEVYLSNRNNLLLPEPDYFGEPTPVADDTPLHQLLGQRLQQILLGECPGAAGGRLTTAIRLVFERNTLTFYNAGDEGCYFLGEETKLWENYTEVYPVTWRDYSQWLRLTGTDVVGLPYQLL